LREIEAVLQKACGTEQVVAIAWPVENGSADGAVAFVSGVNALDQDRVSDYRSRVLPVSMIPRKLYPCAEFPLNANGKIDRVRPVCILNNKEQ
jgi:D-alanine--poly(phosphoribitol) ligase subunit 1